MARTIPGGGALPAFRAVGVRAALPDGRPAAAVIGGFRYPKFLPPAKICNDSSILIQIKTLKGVSPSRTIFSNQLGVAWCCVSQGHNLCT